MQHRGGIKVFNDNIMRLTHSGAWWIKHGVIYKHGRHVRKIAVLKDGVFERAANADARIEHTVSRLFHEWVNSPELEVARGRAISFYKGDQDA